MGIREKRELGLFDGFVGCLFQRLSKGILPHAKGIPLGKGCLWHGEGILQRSPRDLQGGLARWVSGHLVFNKPSGLVVPDIDILVIEF